MADASYPAVQTEAGRRLVAQLDAPAAQLLKAVALHPRLAPVRRLLSGWRGLALVLAVTELLRRRVKAQTKALASRLDGGKQLAEASTADGKDPGAAADADAAAEVPSSAADSAAISAAADAEVPTDAADAEAPTGSGAGAEAPAGSGAAARHESAAHAKEPVILTMPRLYELLVGRDGGMGFSDLAGTVACVILGSLFMIRKSRVMGDIIATVNDGGFSRRCLRYLLQYSLLAILSASLTESTTYMNSRLTLKWRRNVTHKLHSLYFSKMVYYRIQNESKELLIPDPDIRICSDVKETIGMVSGLAVQLVSAITYTLIFGQATWTHRGWGWSLLAPGFFLSAIALLLQCQPPDAGQVTGSLQQHSGRLKQLLTRLQLHAERICMLQGEGFELKRLQLVEEEVHKWSIKKEECFFVADWLHGALFSGGAATMEVTGFFCGAAMGAGDTAAWAAQDGMAGELPFHPARPLRFGPQQLAAQYVGTYGFFDACSGWSSFVGAFFQFQNFAPVTNRLKQLYARLAFLQESSSSEASEVFLDNGPSISFSGVSIATPTGQLLLKELTFSVSEGQTLLICGHNGAGKSSIMRCLCSLWPVVSGKIARPGGAVQAEEDAQLHEQIYYLPQKPCNVLGSLSDQLTYPARLEGGLPEAELRRWLRYVDLEYLVDRQASAGAVSRVEGATDSDDIDWEVLLSLGEQQALSIARLLYHHPRFAILDECTSAVGKLIERRLFEVAREAGISCITIAHRPALREHHSHLLQLTGNLKDDGLGWRLSDIPRAEGTGTLQPTRPWCGDAAEVQRRIEAHLERERQAVGRAKGAGGVVAGAAATESVQSAEHRPHAEAGTAAVPELEALVRRIWPSVWRRVWAVIRLGLRSQDDQRRAARRAVVCLSLIYLRAGALWRYYAGMAGMVRASIVGDLPLCICAYLTTVATAFTSGLLEQLVNHQSGYLFHGISTSAVQHLAQRTLQGAALLSVMRPRNCASPAVENPAMRLAEIQEIFSSLRINIAGPMFPCSTMLYVLPMTVRGVGLASPAMAAVLFMLFRGSQLLVPDFAKIQARLAMLESRFQVLHTRLRSISEPVAFSGGGAAERAIVERHFDAIVDFKERTERRQTLYQIITTFFMDQRNIPIALQRGVAAIFAGRNLPPHPDGVSANTICSNHLFDKALQLPLMAMKSLVTASDALGTVDGSCIRCLELVAALDGIAAPPSAEAPPSSGGISVQGLDLVTRSGSCLARGLAFEARVPTVVTGPNASGKSLLGSVLLGLWPAAGAGARLAVGGAAGPRPPLRALMPAPQRIYLSDGSLAAQLTYPVAPQLPSEPPFELRVGAVPAGAGSEALLEHFRALGPCACRLAGEAQAEVAYEAAAALRKALARPHDRVLAGRQLECELAGGGEGSPRFGRLRRCLQATGTEHVLEREQEGWFAEGAWEDTLSGGEQQRLCFARVLYHGPAFALLDECTSMVAADSEQELYRRLFHDWGITPLTMTQRMFMPDLYAQELSLGASGPQGWELVTAQRRASGEQVESGALSK